MQFALRSAIALVLLAGLIACGDDDTTGPSDTVDLTPYLSDYVSEVVVATYADLRDKAATLATAAAALETSPTQSNADAAAQAWVDARAPWESSEAFLFGPAAFLGLDPALDSWPVDRQQLDDVLSSSLSLTPEFVGEGLGPAVRGFHTIEYLLFRDGQPRAILEFTERELDYLAATTTVLAAEAHSLWASWAEGIDGSGAYASEFANAGRGGSRYPTQAAAMQEWIEAMIAICDEVANGKIADPYDENDPSLVESQFSYNSLTDFANNLRSVRNAYLGEYHVGAFDGVGLDAFVSERDAALDIRVRAEIDAAIDAIGAIPYPFRENLTASNEIEAAQDAIATVLTTLQADVLPLVLE